METFVRAGNFTSSEIYKLMSNNKKGDGFGVPALTYIKAKKREQKLGRSLQKERNARSTSWGKYVEKRVFNLLPLSYKLQSDIRYVHSEIINWTGAPDMLTDETVCDIKAPFSLDVFCDKADIIISKDLDSLKKKFPENYWQLVSNAILTEKNVAELIIYCPYLSELVDIKADTQTYDGNANDIAWINWAEAEELPYLIEGKYYKNLYEYKFEIPESDKQALYERIKLAVEELNK